MSVWCHLNQHCSSRNGLRAKLVFGVWTLSRYLSLTSVTTVSVILSAGRCLDIISSAFVIVSTLSMVKSCSSVWPAFHFYSYRSRLNPQSIKLDMWARIDLVSIIAAPNVPIEWNFRNTKPVLTNTVIICHPSIIKTTVHTQFVRDVLQTRLTHEHTARNSSNIDAYDRVER